VSAAARDAAAGSTTTLLLLRHAAHGLVDRVLCGRMPGVRLGEPGRRQAAALAGRMAPERPVAVYASPQMRARETADVIAARCGLAVQPCDALEEIDFGAWTGRSFEALADDPHWQRWNGARAAERPPGGESMAEAQRRAMRWAEGLPARHAGATVAAVSHADVIKAVLSAVLTLPLDEHWRFEVSPAGVSKVQLRQDGGSRVLCINEVVAA
jgi:broad specificity phosphatase PhoE